MILFDTTKTGAAGHRSGLTRVSSRLLHELGGAARPVVWPDLREAVRDGDCFVTAELFSEEERPGFTAFLERQGCRKAAIFHDAIPLKHPRITWPQSVARHPGYMTLLSKCDHVWAVSEQSRRELEGFWRWQGRAAVPSVRVLPLGADFNGAPRVAAREVPRGIPRLLCVGILEPRKNQLFLAEVCDALWREGLEFELHVVGRMNPHFGDPVAARLKQLARQRPGAVILHDSADDQTLAGLYAAARATVFPTIAEGCGLPLLESLWMGVPCVCSDLPVLRENAEGGGCVMARLNDAASWAEELRRVLTNDSVAERLTREALGRPLPTWADAAKVIRRLV